MATKKGTKKSSGRAMNIYLAEADIARIRKLSAWLTTHGHRVSDSQTIKATLIAAKPDAALLKAFQKVLDADLRYK